jgi:hypothetical protein
MGPDPDLISPVAMVTPMPEAPDGYDAANVVPVLITASDIIRWDTGIKAVRAVDQAQNSAAITDRGRPSRGQLKFSLGIC